MDLIDQPSGIDQSRADIAAAAKRIGFADIGQLRAAVDPAAAGIGVLLHRLLQLESEVPNGELGSITIPADRLDHAVID